MKVILAQVKSKLLGRHKKTFNVYWSSNKKIAGKDWDNFGDALVPLLVERMSGREVKWEPKSFKKGKVFFVIGSILEQAGKGNIVWGAGIIKSTSKLKSSTYLAVRGPISYSRVLANGHSMEPNWGDPALLCPYYFPVAKKIQRSKVTIVPHYVDYERVVEKYRTDEQVEVIDVKDPNVELLIEKLATSSFVLSSSLHGLIVAHAYGVKAAWVQFSEKLDGDDIKFNDYFLSVGIRLYKPFVYSKDLDLSAIERDHVLPDYPTLQQVRHNLLKTCPFFIK